MVVLCLNRCQCIVSLGWKWNRGFLVVLSLHEMRRESGWIGVMRNQDLRLSFTSLACCLSSHRELPALAIPCSWEKSQNFRRKAAQKGKCCCRTFVLDALWDIWKTNLGCLGYAHLYVWCAGTTPILKKTLREFGLKFWRPTIPRDAPRVAPRIGFSHKLGRERHSENCSENTPEFRELLREWTFHSESVFFQNWGGSQVSEYVTKTILICVSRFVRWGLRIGEEVFMGRTCMCCFLF